MQFLVTLAQAADVINPHLSTPCIPELSDEIELDMDESSNKEQEDEDSLSFEGDITDMLQ